MKLSEIPERRLGTQRVAGPQATKFATVAEAVRTLAAVQSQDYPAAKWGVGQRVRDCTEAAFSGGEILRTHVLRPTWHFVAPDDLRWMLALTAPRVNALRAYSNRQHGLDAPTFARSNAAIAKALRGGSHLTRDELGEVLAERRSAAVWNGERTSSSARSSRGSCAADRSAARRTRTRSSRSVCRRRGGCLTARSRSRAWRNASSRVTAPRR